jgi:hypothetical protein
MSSRLRARRIGVVDLVLVDALARLCLAAKRRGWTVVIGDPGAELGGLFELCGLSELLLEMVGQSEGGEQLGIDEIVKGDDPAV